MAIRDDFEIVAGQVRAVVQRFALVLLVVTAFGAMLIGKADTVLVEQARVWALDLASPALEAIARPVAAANRVIADLKEFASLRQENARLREENARLLAWQTAARRLENRLLAAGAILVFVLGKLGVVANPETLAEVDRALVKLDEGSYGTCDSCGATIPEGRLEVHPWAVRCVACARRKVAASSSIGCSR